jgi:hypothetical protein
MAMYYIPAGETGPADRYPESTLSPVFDFKKLAYIY